MIIDKIECVFVVVYVVWLWLDVVWFVGVVVFVGYVYGVFVFVVDWKG